MNRNTWALAAAIVAVVAVIVLGLLDLGGPGTQRKVQGDLQTVRRISELSQRLQMSWSGSGKVLPENLDQFPAAIRQSPVTNQPFVYRPKSGSAYDLCATFATDNRNLSPQNPPDAWTHPKGEYCFHLDASQPAPPAPFFY